MDPVTLLTMFAPLLVSGGKALISRITGGSPAVTTPEDYAKIAASDVAKLEALAKLDATAEAGYPWVAAVRALQRPAVVAAVLLAWLVGILFDMEDVKFELVTNLASAVFFYLFGERVMLRRGK